mmetsp:Transcript_26843/g.48249  ORF Transcript_26843/g.48249 Transcript_26843/m.48249 type:complete len:290 (-) Transcript_26843:239-1108(-)
MECPGPRPSAPPGSRSCPEHGCSAPGDAVQDLVVHEVSQRVPLPLPHLPQVRPREPQLLAELVALVVGPERAEPHRLRGEDDRGVGQDQPAVRPPVADHERLQVRHHERPPADVRREVGEGVGDGVPVGPVPGPIAAGAGPVGRGEVAQVSGPEGLRGHQEGALAARVPPVGELEHGDLDGVQLPLAHPQGRELPREGARHGMGRALPEAVVLLPGQRQLGQVVLEGRTVRVEGVHGARGLAQVLHAEAHAVEAVGERFLLDLHADLMGRPAVPRVVEGVLEGALGRGG